MLEGLGARFAVDVGRDGRRALVREEVGGGVGVGGAVPEGWVAGRGEVPDLEAELGGEVVELVEGSWGFGDGVRVGGLEALWRGRLHRQVELGLAKDQVVKDQVVKDQLLLLALGRDVARHFEGVCGVVDERLFECSVKVAGERRT